MPAASAAAPAEDSKCWPNRNTANGTNACAAYFNVGFVVQWLPVTCRVWCASTCRAQRSGAQLVGLCLHQRMRVVCVLGCTNVLNECPPQVPAETTASVVSVLTWLSMLKAEACLRSLWDDGWHRVLASWKRC